MPSLATSIRLESSLSAGTLTVFPSGLIWYGMLFAASRLARDCASVGSIPVMSGL